MNGIAYSSSKVTPRPDCIFEIHLLWQSGFNRVYSNSCCSYSFKPEIIRIDQSSHKMYITNILNFQESTTILNACTKKDWELIDIYIYIYIYKWVRLYVCVSMPILHWFIYTISPTQRSIFKNFLIRFFLGKTVFSWSYVKSQSIEGHKNNWHRNNTAICLITSVHYIYIYIYISSYNVWKHVRYPSLISRQPGDNTVSVAQGGNSTPGATEQLLPPDRVFKRNIYLCIHKIN